MIKTFFIPGSRFMSTSLVAVVLLLLSGCDPAQERSPYAPEDALHTFQLPEGFSIELVASEPLITDPVEIAFDADGLLYVAEMEDYPAQDIPGGRIMLLEDKDHDGHYESGNVFAENLPYVNGVMPWRKGVLVTTAPDIIYLEDTTGDRRADVRRIVLTGFALTNPQLRMSSLRYGPDNWIYGAYSRSGGQRGYPQFTNHGHALRFSDNPVADSADIYPGTDFRFRPDEFKVEPSGGMSQFGLAFDAAGNRFTVWNNIHLRHVVVDGRYPARNPYLSVTLMASVSDHGDAAPVYSRAENRLDLHESEIGHFTSACGHSIYTGGIFPGNYHGAAFVCEPVSNLVHADLLTAKGATFTGRRSKEHAEFLTSTDSWFRPVNTTVGPDGGLYVVDFYRKLVEHPAWIARADDKGIYTHAGVLQESDFLEGNDRGRIYRIAPEDHQYKDSEKPTLRTADPGTLVSYLAHPNMWWRTTAQRLLVERQDPSAVPALKKLAARSETSPEGKIHALRTLEGMNGLDDHLILKALTDESSAVRKQAVLLAEGRLSNLEIQHRLLEMAGDADDQVQFQVALTLSALPTDRSFEQLRQIALRHLDDPWFQTAVLLSARENSLIWFRSVSEFEVSGKESRDGKLRFLEKIASVTGARHRTQDISEMVSFIRHDKDPSFQRAGLNGLREGMRQVSGRMKLSLQGQSDLFKLIASNTPEVQNAALEIAEKIDLVKSQFVQTAVNQALKLALDPEAATGMRAHAARVLGLDPGGIRFHIFDQLLSPKQPEDVQSAAARVLTRSDDTLAMRLLLDRWHAYTAEVRGIVESGFTSSLNRVSFLMNAVEKGEIQPLWLSRTTRLRLAQHSDKEIQHRAEKLFRDLQEDSRDEVVTAYYEATTLGGDPLKGKVVFKTACSTCHQLGDVGRAFGPDLLSVTNQTRINLLTMILNPNNNIAPGYDGYLIETTDGRSFLGIMGHESAARVILRTADGNEQMVARDNIKTIRPMTASLMPDGLEADLSTQDIADLLEYLKKPGL